MSSSVYARTLARISGRPETLTGDSRRMERFLPQVMGPTWTLASSPTAAEEALADILDRGTPEGRVRLGRLRRRSHEDVLMDEHGDRTLGGQRCCFLLMHNVTGRMHEIAIPSDHACTCGNVWRLEYRLRNEVKRG